MIILKIAVEHSKIPFALSLSKGERDFGMLTKWVGVWEPLMLRQAQHERLPYTSTAVFRIIDLKNHNEITVTEHLAMAKQLRAKTANYLLTDEEIDKAKSEGRP